MNNTFSYGFSTKRTGLMNSCIEIKIYMKIIELNEIDTSIRNHLDTEVFSILYVKNHNIFMYF